MLTITANTEALERFQTRLADYAAGSTRSASEVLDVKGRDLGIKLFKGFQAVRFGAGRKGIAMAELIARRNLGKGTKVRPSLQQEYRHQRGLINSTLRSVGQNLRRYSGTLDGWTAVAARREKLREERRHLWRDTVRREVAIRQASVGALAASFLWYRTRANSTVGTYYVRNRYSGRPPLGYIERLRTALRIVGVTPALAVVDRRHGIVSRALDQASREMLEWMMQRTLKAMGGAA